MDSQRWKQVEEVLQAALELAPAEREAFVSRACEGDPGLALEVRSLLGSGAEAEHFLEKPAIEVAAKAMADRMTAPDQAESLVGLSFSHYRIVEKLGGGGMGVVYKAEDTRLHRFVALKFLSDIVARDARALDRFRREARAASALNHPNLCTIYDVGEQDGRAYLVMEYLQGQTLKQHIAGRPLPLELLVSLGVQIADGLAAAHRAGIIHRDIKPGNIFVAEGRQVKILDFGLAQFAARDHMQEAITETGATLGTAGYMSPEQVAGKALDSRSDLFSFGVVLLEMATGERPVAGARPAGIAPPELAVLIGKCLEYDRERRYRQASEIRDGLHRLLQADARRPVFTRRRAMAAAAMLACSAAGYFYLRLVPKLTAQDTIVLADFANSTGDPVFDGALQQGLAVQLGQSPYLSIVPEQRVRRTLPLMNHPPDARLNPELARGVCERAGGSAMVEGSIAPLGSSYVIGLRATNCRTGVVLAEEQAQANRKEDVLNALSDVARKFRARLGESLATVQEHGTPLAEATTTSLEALKAYSDGLKVLRSTSPDAGLRLFQRAVELDPNFAMAYNWLGWMYGDLDEFEKSMQSMRKAYELRDRASDAERFHITASYERLVTGNMERVQQVGELWARTYPRVALPHGVLMGLPYVTVGKYEQAIEHAKKAVELDPDFAMGYYGLSQRSLALNRVAEAEDAIRRAFARKFQIQELYYGLHNVAFYKGDASGMERALELSKVHPDAEALAKERQAFALAYSGRLHEARVIMRHAIDAAIQAGHHERAGEWEAAVALWEAFFGNTQRARQEIAAALELSRGRDLRYCAGLTLALLGDSAQPETFARELEEQFPEDTSIRFSYVPVLRARIALNQGDPDKAIQLLEPAIPYELGMPRISGAMGIGALYPVYLRGEAYLAARQPAKAAAEFQRIADHFSIVLSDPVGVAARVQRARALQAAGELARAKEAYREFLALWKDADPEVPLLQQAKGEFAKLP